MSELRSGQIVEATVTGFFPGRQVVLDVDGETFLVWSNLPLVRGAIIRAAVEPSGAGIRLRLVEERRTPKTGGAHPAPSPQGAAADELDLVIAKTADDLGLQLDERLAFEVRDRLRTLDARLEREPVPLGRLSGEIRSLLVLRARGLAPSARLRWVMNSSGRARLGTALLRVGEGLTSAARVFGRDIATVLEDRAISLERFFVDLDSPVLASNLGEVLRRCGYSHEMNRAQSDDTDAKGGEDSEEDLKGELLWLRSSLREIMNSRFAPSRESARRELDRLLAWCGRALDIIEGVQIQNLPSLWETVTEQEFAFQLPVRWRDLKGTLLYTLERGQSRFRVELLNRDCLGVEVNSAPEVGTSQINLYLPEPLEREMSATEMEWPVGVNIRPVRDMDGGAEHPDEAGGVARELSLLL